MLSLRSSQLAQNHDLGVIVSEVFAPSVLVDTLVLLVVEARLHFANSISDQTLDCRKIAHFFIWLQINVPDREHGKATLLHC